MNRSVNVMHCSITIPEQPRQCRGVSGMGCSLRGGEGSDRRHPARRATLLQVLQNLVNLLGIPSSLNFAVMGAVILMGVITDQLLQRRTARA